MEPRSYYNGPEINIEAIMFESKVVVITFCTFAARVLAAVI